MSDANDPAFGPDSYPVTARGDVVETLHGREIADPYRWLEDPDSTETADWVSRQNAFTESRLAELPSRGWFTEVMTSIMHRPRAGCPVEHGGRYLLARNNGYQNQNVIFVADSLTELLEGGRVLLDPNELSPDGTTSVLGYTLSDDGRYFAYALSEGGSDWLIFKIIDLSTGGSGSPVDDADIQTKFSLPAWLPDNRSYLYTAFEHDELVTGTQTAALGGARLKLHRLGRAVESDELVLEFPDNDRLMFSSTVTLDHRYVIVPIVEGTENRNRVWVYEIVDGPDGAVLSEPIKLVDVASAEYEFVRNDGPQLYFLTDDEAERGRVVRCDLEQAKRSGRPEFVEVIAEGAATRSGVFAAGDLMISYELDDARPVLTRYTVDGTEVGRIDVPGGALVGIDTEPGRDEFFVGMSSVVSPTTAFVGSARTGELRALPELVVADDSAADQPVFRPPAVHTERRRARSADGTEVPYFVISREDLSLDHPRPTLLYGYGGFKIPVLADYRAAWPGWLAAGGVLAIANLRGGGEFGTSWYDAGRLDRKQNVFDDFAAVAEDLIATRLTTSDRLALHGGSNGGLLVGAMITQRPGLAAAAIPAVGVLDLLRFHKFTIGSAWVSDYGNPDEPDAFATALAYSPLHNVQDGENYPATLVLTGDHDDRVVPLHSHKFTATLQRAQAGPAPILTRIETSTGHGAGKPTDKAAAETADLLAFAAAHTGLTPPPVP